jgi:hypothetical protein
VQFTPLTFRKYVYTLGFLLFLLNSSVLLGAIALQHPLVRSRYSPHTHINGKWSRGADGNAQGEAPRRSSCRDAGQLQNSRDAHHTPSLRAQLTNCCDP